MTGAYAPVFCFRYNPSMKWNRWFGIVLGVISATCLIFSFWPLSVHTDQISFSNPDGIAGTLYLTQHTKIHVGDKAEISLRIVIDQGLNKNILINCLSKLEMGYLEVNPKGEGNVFIDLNKSVVFNWQLSPYKAGSYSGTMWLFLKSTGGDRDLILARPIEMTANTLFGLSYKAIRTISIIGLTMGIILIIPIVIKKKRLQTNHT